MDRYEDSFDPIAGADASKTFPKQCSNLKKGDFVILKDKVCHLVEVVTSKPGKHGHAKVRLTGLDVFSKKKYEDFFPASQKVHVPFVNRKEYQLVNISYEGYYVTLLDVETYKTRSDLKLPDDEIGTQIKTLFEKDESDIVVVVLSALDEEKIISFKTVSSDKK